MAELSDLFRAHVARLKKISARRKAGRPLSAEDLAFLDPAGAAAGTSPAQTSFDSIAAAAAALGVTVAELRRAKKRGAPGFKGGRVYALQLLPWLREQRAKDPTSPPDKDTLECRRLLALCERVEIANKITLGEYLPRVAAERELRTIGELLKHTLRTVLEDDLPPLLEGLNAAAIRVQMKEVNDRLCAMLHAHTGKTIARPPAHSPSEPPPADADGGPTH